MFEPPLGRDAVVVEVRIEQAQVQLLNGVPLQALHDTQFWDDDHRSILR